ncbi:hypothetical protein CRDco_1040 [Candidatus Carsonella ruddii (Diaphorina cf. continua)]|uniref:50S ribosomal protein L35 n=1 Tax=Candidatus Carsonella ruddii (Diaphorina cf. continua) TaxID=2661587 RepID=A0A7R6VYH7_CARRU|nr:hypothetical protein CRDco_1040 [Candidatus Carsonella ruddii (Diaphorina cf. continua)]
MKIKKKSINSIKKRIILKKKIKCLKSNQHHLLINKNKKKNSYKNKFSYLSKIIVSKIKKYGSIK